jgi:2'-5' RNA ligase
VLAVASAVIVRARLPVGLERLRRRGVGGGEGARGVPAHVTLLHPFVGDLDPSIRREVATVAARHAPFNYTMTGPARWPDTIYVAVEPIEPFVRLQADLAAAFPAYPIYGEGSGFEFTPHITIADGRAVEREDSMTRDAWAALPMSARAAWLEVIASDGAQWDLVWRMPLGGG